MIRAVLFDLDGTLNNTLSDIAFAMNRALRLHDLPEWPEDAYRYLVGNGAKKLAQRAARDRQDLWEDVFRDYQSYYQDHALDRTQPYDGIPELLQALREKDLKLCVFSNKPHADTCTVIRHFFPEDTFEDIRGQKEGVPVKPAPDGAFAAAEALGVRPEEFLYLGDTSVDMECAKNAGMHPVGVLWGFREEQELRESGAEYIIAHPSELLQLL